MSSKRAANSPAEKAPENKRSVAVPVALPKEVMSVKPKDPTKGSLVKFEVVSINNAPFYGTLAEIEILHIWEKVLGRCRSEIYVG
jgi:hypothetical protein